MNLCLRPGNPSQSRLDQYISGQSWSRKMVFNQVYDMNIYRAFFSTCICSRGDQYRRPSLGILRKRVLSHNRYPGSTVGIGHKLGPVCVCLCVYSQPVRPYFHYGLSICDNLWPVQARINKYWPKGQNTLDKIPTHLGVDWLRTWSWRQILLKRTIYIIWACCVLRAFSHHSDKFPCIQFCVQRSSCMINTLRPRQNGRHFADDIFKCSFFNENVWIPIKISLKFVPKGSINNNLALFEIMAWCRPGDKPSSGPMMVRLPTYICVTRSQWVKMILRSWGVIQDREEP